MSLATQISLRISSERLLPQDLQTARAALDTLFSLVLSSGVGAGQADNVFSDELTILTGATQDLDFAGGGLLDTLGAALTFVKVKALVVIADPTNTTNVTLQPKAGAGLPFLGGTTPTTLLTPGGAFLLFNPSAAGIAVGAGTTDAISLVNAAGASAKVKVIAIGTTA